MILGFVFNRRENSALIRARPIPPVDEKKRRKRLGSARADDVDLALGLLPCAGGNRPEFAFFAGLRFTFVMSVSAA